MNRLKFRIFAWIIIIILLIQRWLAKHGGLSVVFTIGGQQQPGGTMYLLPDDRKVNVGVAFVDAAGNPAIVDGVPAWSSSDESVVMAVAATDGMSATVIATGPLGTAQVSVSGDADLGTGVENVIGILDVEVVGGKAVAAVLTPGESEPK